MLDLDWMRTRIRKASKRGAGNWGEAWCEAYVDDVTALIGAVEGAAVIHRQSTFPASTGYHRGKHWCVGCTTSVDDFTAYVDWPCPTIIALGLAETNEAAAAQ